MQYEGCCPALPASWVVWRPILDVDVIAGIQSPACADRRLDVGKGQIGHQRSKPLAPDIATQRTTPMTAMGLPRRTV